jgi:catechol O-methyltransferase
MSSLSSVVSSSPFSSLILALAGYVAIGTLKRALYPNPTKGINDITARQVLSTVYETAKEGNPQSVLDAIDRYGWDFQWLMNVGDDKAKLIKDILNEKKPKIAVELGGFLGYSAIMFASHMPADSHFYSIELDPLHGAVASKLIEFAGLKDKVTILTGCWESVHKRLREVHGVKHIDLLFLDHEKTVYLSDFQSVEREDFLHPGSLVIADNCVYPGCPDYVEFMMAHEGYKSRFIESHLEYRETVQDKLLVSEKL